jgi:hypothetical protein
MKAARRCSDLVHQNKTEQSLASFGFESLRATSRASNKITFRELGSSEFFNDLESGMPRAVEFLRHAMRLFISIVGVAVVGIAACNSYSNNTPVQPVPSQALRDYSAGASAGDFLTLTVDPVSETLSYENRSNNDNSTAQFSPQPDGSYKIDDPSGNLTKAYEVPGHFLIAEGTKLGIDHNSSALITAVASKPISINQVSAENFNYMEFRTIRGGFSIGTFHIDSQGNVAISCYVPFGDYFESAPFNRGTFPATSLAQDASGNFLKVGNPDGSASYIFNTDNVLIVDRPDGVTIGFKKAGTKEFDPIYSGTYQISLFQKLGAAATSVTTETGDAGFDEASLVVGVEGQVELKNSSNHVVAQGLLTPIANVSYLFNGGIFSIDDPCDGIFTLHIASPTSQQDLFIAFDRSAALFAGFRTNLPLDRSNTYDYYYGIALKK